MPIARSQVAHVVSTGVFPLGIHSSGRYLVDASGNPRLLFGDTPWSLISQLTNAQIDTYVAWLSATGQTAILLQVPVYLFGDGGAAGGNAVKDVDGNSPFTTMTPNFNWLLTSAYWARFDYLVASCKAIGVAVLLNPAYEGGSDGSQGCRAEVNAASAGTLQTYGSTLATRYIGYGNVMLCSGGDYVVDSTYRAKEWNIITGWRSVNSNVLVTAHSQRSADPYGAWGPAGDNLTGYNLNNIYCASDGSNGYSLAATAYGRSPAMPFHVIEDGYENEATLAEFRRAKYQAMCSGACGFFYGEKPRWDFGSAAWGTGGAANAIANHLSTTGQTQVGYLRSLLLAYSWWKLVPKTDTSLVSTGLGTGTGRVCPALASDGTFAFIYSPAVNVTVVMTNFVQSSVRIRLYDPTTGSFSSVGTFANTGSQSVTVSSESVVVCD